jgi:RluA family pseudouridine synthase
MKSWRVSPEYFGVKLVSFLCRELGNDYSNRKLKQAIESNLCFVNHSIERFASRRLEEGDLVQFDESAIKRIPPKIFQLESKRVLYEDDFLLFYDKPSGLTSDGTGLAGLFRNLHIIHRLDRETTGVIMFAKTIEMQQSIISLFTKFQVSKVYLALVDGVVERDAGVIENYIGRVSEDNNKELWGVVPEWAGRFAKTSWSCIKRGENATLIRCTPKTGRTHQIRIHMRELGHPILGDFRYSKKYISTYHPKRCMLHAQSLCIMHPKTGSLIDIKASLPEDFSYAMENVLD